MRNLGEELTDDQRWELIASAIGSIADHGHDWDDDPAEWVREQRLSSYGPADSREA